MNWSRTTVWAGAFIVLAACTQPTTPQSRAHQATVTACRTRADEIYQRQNRGSLYLQDSRDAPESGSYNSGITTRGLAERYVWDRQVADCIRSEGAKSGQPTSPQVATPGPTMVPSPR